MTRRMRWLNALGLAVALLASVAAGVRSFDFSSREDAPKARVENEAFPLRQGPSGLEVRDQSGAYLPLVRYARIASGSTIADDALFQFCEPDRVVAFTSFSEQNPTVAHRYVGKPKVAALEDLETLLRLKPDLVLINTLGAEPRVERLREANIRVFDLGEMRGLSTFLAQLRVIALIVGRPELGEDYARQFQRRLEHVAPPGTSFGGAVYLSVFGTSLYGGGRNTSYDDLLRYAGFSNLLAQGYSGWPALRTEDVLALDPRYIVTHNGMGETLCERPGFDQLSACARRQETIIELPPALLSDPGSGMLQAAEQLHDAAVSRSKNPRSLP